ncbi:MAG: hypothetical protein M1835_003928 [Candelina submexicana]|nr:MAG: hypothetical protein M1835_003928 [Candelina submexicana]
MDFVNYHVTTYPNDVVQTTGNVITNEKTESPLALQHQDDAKAARPAEEHYEDNDVLVAEENEGNEVSTRPRLTPDQVWQLEKQFELHHKPNSTTKRQLAAETGLSHQRVANWFQNRRAKAKHAKKQEEFEVLRTAESASRSIDERFPTSAFLHSFDSNQTSQVWVPGEGAPPQNLACSTDLPFHHNQYPSPSDASYASLQRSLAAAQAAYLQGSFSDIGVEESNRVLVPDEITFAPVGLQNQDHSKSGGACSFPSSAFSEWGSSKASSVRWTPAHQLEDPFDIHIINSQQPLSDIRQQQSCQAFDENFASVINAQQFQNPFMVADFPLQTLGEVQHQPSGPTAFIGSPAQVDEGIHSRRDSYSSDLINNLNNVEIDAGPAKEIVFKQPQTLPNLAVRRQRQRPAALGNASMRSQSLMASNPVSPNGSGSYLGPSLPMRRIKSTGNNLNTNRGRIQKNTPGSAQRSPLNFESFADAAAFEDARFVNTTPTTSQSMSFSGSLAPPTPLSPLDMDCWQLGHTNIPTRDDPSFNSDSGITGYCVSSGLSMEASLESPPNTPLDFDVVPQMQNTKQVQRSPFSSAPQPQFLHYSPPHSSASPEILSFPPTLHMPQPVQVPTLNCGSDYSPEQTKGSHKTIPEFFFHEFPQQPPSQDVPQHRPRKYVFSHQTPDDFQA